MLLPEAIDRWAQKHSAPIKRCLSDAGILSWQDITNERLNIFKDIVADTYAPNTTKTYFAELRAVLGKVDEDIPAQYQSILRKKAEKPLKTYLDKNDLVKLESVRTRSESERGVLYTFLVSAYTGCRISDAERLRTTNINNGMLCYVSQKTSTKATVPCGQKVTNWITWIEANDFHITLANYNILLRNLCERARIDDKVITYHAGQTIVDAKWKSVSSHTGRISFATNMARLHTPILEISQMMGHSSPTMTARYIVMQDVNLNKEQMSYFM